MADVDKTVAIIFSGEDRVSKTIRNISGSFSKLDLLVDSVADPLAKVADGVLAADAALATFALGGIAYAFMKSKEFESAIIDLEKVMGDNESVTKELQDQFTALSRTYGESTTTIVDSLAGLRQSGYSTSDSLKILETSLKLARASELSAGEATEFLKRSLIGYNLSAKDAIGLGDLWNQTSNVANTTVGKLAEGFAVVSRQAKDAGFSLSQTSAVLTPVIGVFDSGSEAGRAFSMTLTRLLNPTKEGESAIRKLTGATGPLNQEFANGRELFEAVAKGLQSVDDRTASVYVSQIAGADQAKRIKVAFDDYAKTLTKIGPASAQYNSLQKEVDKQNASTEASVDRLKTGFSELAKTIGLQYMEASKHAIDGGTAIENALQDAVKDGTFKPLFDALNNFGDKLGDYLTAVAKAVPEAFKEVDFNQFVDAMKELGVEAETLFGDLDLTKPEDLAKAIQGAVDTIESLIRVTSGMVESITPVVLGIKNFILGFNELDDEVQKGAGNIIGAAKAVHEAGLTIIAATVAIGNSAKMAEGTLKVLAGSTMVFYKAMSAVFNGMVTAIVGIPFAINKALASITWGDRAAHFKKEAEEWKEALKIPLAEGVYDLQGVVDGWSMAAEGFTGKTKESTQEVKKLTDSVEQLALKTPTDPMKLEVLIPIKQDPKENAEKVVQEMAQVGLKADGTPLMLAANLLATVDKESIEKTQKAINGLDKDLLKKLEIEAEVDETRIKATADTMQSIFEWEAKVDIAQVEAAADATKALADMLTQSFDDTGETLTDLFGLLGEGDLSLGERWNLQDAIDEERRNREALLDMQKEMHDAQLQLIKDKRQALKRGDGILKVSMEGVEPAVELLLWEVAKKIQIRANEVAAEFLLGI